MWHFREETVCPTSRTSMMVGHLTQGGQLTNSMKRSPSWEADSLSLVKKFPAFYGNLKFHFRVHNIPPLVPTLSQMNPVHNFPPYLPKIHSNIILPSTSRFSEWSLPFRFPYRAIIHMTSPARATCPTHLIFLDLTTVIFGEVFKLW